MGPQLKIQRCIGCGCTDDRACPGGCYWVGKNPPVCSACIQSGKLCEASDDGEHRLTWLNPTNGYCEHCRLAFVALEVAS
jgi:hypothetical protein